MCTHSPVLLQMGASGSGKTTLLDAISGVPPCSLAIGACGPVSAELSMSSRIRLSTFRFTLLYCPHWLATHVTQLPPVTMNKSIMTGGR